MIGKVLVDVTEPEHLEKTLSEMCLKKGVSVERRELRRHSNAKPETLKENPFMGASADYIVCDSQEKALLGIERKTYKDAVLSMMQKEEKNRGHIFKQLDNLKKFPNRIFILEGSMPANYNRLETNIYGVQFWCYRNQIGVVHTSGIEGSAKAIYVLAKKVLGVD
jgi:ERCC4-type nuclease